LKYQKHEEGLLSFAFYFQRLPSMRPYQYRCNDNSLLTPTFKKWIVAPMARFVPWGIPANIITIVSNFFVYIALYLALDPSWLGDFATRLYVSACFLMYLIGDHLDGMQAKRTGTGSALGEFCDHYLDAFNNGVIVFTMLTIFKVTNPWIVATCLTTSYMAHTSVFYEQFKTGWLTFEKMGSLEGVLFAAFIIGISVIAPVSDFLSLTVMGILSVFELLMLSSALGAVLTFINTWKRTPDVKVNFWIFMLLLISISVVGVLSLSNYDMFWLITLYASLYIGRIMQGHLVDGVERHTDFVAPLALLVLALWQRYSPDEFPPMYVVVYLLICIGILIFQVFSKLKAHWVWLNASEKA
jgi:phosphatidylglycerophosphate synthase